MIATKGTIYLITNVFYAYILCKFMRVFFGQKGKNVKIEVFSFIAYYCINSIIYLFFQEIKITICSNIACYFLLTFNYSVGLKLRITSVIFIYALLFSSETIALLLLQAIGMNHFSSFSTMEFLMAQILVELICYTIVLIFSNYKLRQKDYPIPMLHWIAIITIPIGTFLPTFIITETIIPDKIGIMMVSEIVILFVNFLCFIYMMISQNCIWN